MHAVPGAHQRSALLAVGVFQQSCGAGFHTAYLLSVFSALPRMRLPASRSAVLTER